VECVEIGSGCGPVADFVKTTAKLRVPYNAKNFVKAEQLLAS
jgi:hypothetical protein